jgi:hypothetical protein
MFTVESQLRFTLLARDDEKQFEESEGGNSCTDDICLYASAANVSKKARRISAWLLRYAS